MLYRRSATSPANGTAFNQNVFDIYPKLLEFSGWRRDLSAIESQSWTEGTVNWWNIGIADRTETRARCTENSQTGYDIEKVPDFNVYAVYNDERASSRTLRSSAIPLMDQPFMRTWFPVFSNVCLELAATNSSHQWFSDCF